MLSRLGQPLRTGRLLALAPRAGGATRALAAAGSPTSVRVEETGEAGSPYAVRGQSGRHVLLGDLMQQAGGRDVGPSPKEYVLMALGACTAMTMRIYGENMIKSGKWPGRSIRRLTVECEEVAAAPGGAEKHLPAGLRVTVSLDADLDEEQTRRLLAAAGKCPVKRMLKGELAEGVTTVLKAAGGDK